MLNFLESSYQLIDSFDPNFLKGLNRFNLKDSNKWMRHLVEIIKVIKRDILDPNTETRDRTKITFIYDQMDQLRDQIDISNLINSRLKILLGLGLKSTDLELYHEIQKDEYNQNLGQF